MQRYRELPPPRRLARFVECVWSLAPDASRAARRLDRIFPDGAADVVISAGRATVHAPASSFRLLHLDAPIAGIRIRKGAARIMLGARPDELGTHPIAIGMLWGRRARELEDRIAATWTPSDQIGLLVDFLAERIADGGDLDQAVQAVIERIDLTPESAMRQLGCDVGVSERHLRRRFRDHVGLGIKYYARIARFQHLLDATRNHKRLSGATSPGWAGMACEHGFADQAHLIEEVRTFAGLTPIELLAVV